VKPWSSFLAAGSCPCVVESANRVTSDWWCQRRWCLIRSSCLVQLHHTIDEVNSKLLLVQSEHNAWRAALTPAQDNATENARQVNKVMKQNSCTLEA
jgi:hypothetical protein